MSNNEDYLDDLLNSVSGRNDKKDITDLLKSVRQDETKAARERESKKHRREFGREFYREFEQELKVAAEDEFIRDFELELDTEEADAKQESVYSSDNSQMEQLAGDTDFLGKETEMNEPVEDAPMFFSENHLDEEIEEEDSQLQTMDADDSDTLSFLNNSDETLDIAEVSDASMVEDTPFMDREESFVNEPEELLLDEAEESLFDELEEPTFDEMEEQIVDENSLDTEESGKNEEVDDLMSLLSGLTDDQELSDIGALLKADEEDVDITDGAAGELEKLGSIEGLSDIKNGKKKKEKDKSNKNGFLAKLAALLFGEDEEQSPMTVEEEGTIDGISDENLDILRELDSPADGGKKAKKEKKPKEKKEKEPKPKKEKVKKEKVPKEKKPKEPDLTPPLPKKPVILIAIMAFSIFLLIFLGQKLVGYSNNLTEAQTNYKNENYTVAYDAIAGMSMKTKDQKFYDQCLVMAMVQEEYNAYVSLMDAGQNDMALDSLVRAVGRYEKYYDKADEYGILPEYNKLEAQIEQTLSDQFGVSKDQAMELYGMNDREDYSKGIRQILDKLGLK